MKTAVQIAAARRAQKLRDEDHFTRLGHLPDRNADGRCRLCKNKQARERDRAAAAVVAEQMSLDLKRHAKRAAAERSPWESTRLEDIFGEFPIIADTEDYLHGIDSLLISGRCKTEAEAVRFCMLEGTLPRELGKAWLARIANHGRIGGHWPREKMRNTNGKESPWD